MMKTYPNRQARLCQWWCPVLMPWWTEDADTDKVNPLPVFYITLAESVLSIGLWNQTQGYTWTNYLISGIGAASLWLIIFTRNNYIYSLTLSHSIHIAVPCSRAQISTRIDGLLFYKAVFRPLHCGCCFDSRTQSKCSRSMCSGVGGMEDGTVHPGRSECKRSRLSRLLQRRPQVYQRSRLPLRRHALKNSESCRDRSRHSHDHSHALPNLWQARWLQVRR